MPEEIFEKTTNWPKIILVAVLGFGLLAAAAYAGYWYGTQQVQQIEKPTPVASQPTPTSKPLSEPTPTPTPPTIDPTAGWESYKSTRVGYSIKVPLSWKVTQNEDDSLLSRQDYVTNMTLVPESEGEGIIGNSVTIAFPISIQGAHTDLGKQFEGGLEGLALPSKDEPSTWFTKQESSYTQVDGRRALIKIKVYKSAPPSDFVGGWCNCTHKHIYIDTEDGKILDILGYWQNSNQQFETIFNQILSTFKFLD